MLKTSTSVLGQAYWVLGKLNGSIRKMQVDSDFYTASYCAMRILICIARLFLPRQSILSKLQHMHLHAALCVR